MNTANSEIDVSSQDLPHPTVQSHSPIESNATFYGSSQKDWRSPTTVHFRQIQLNDEQRLKDFFASHSINTIYLRYGMIVREMTHERALQLVQLDGYEELALVGLIGTRETKRIIAVGRYALDKKTNLAEVAFVVHESYRCMGIATYLLRCLTSIIRDNGFAGITAQVRMTNIPMIDVLNEVLGDADSVDSSLDEITMCWHFTPAISSVEENT